VYRGEIGIRVGEGRARRLAYDADKTLRNGASLQLAYTAGTLVCFFFCFLATQRLLFLKVDLDVQKLNERYKKMRGGGKKAPTALAWPFGKFLLIINYFPQQTVLTSVLKEK